MQLGIFKRRTMAKAMRKRQKTSRQKQEINYSARIQIDRRASTGGSLDARHEGNRPATIPTIVANIIAPMISSGVIAGVLNVDKPVGLTSFDVVARVRRAAGVKRVGHAGTLDPLASGVLLICLGQATRIVSYLHDAPKVYLAGVRLGERTSTYDAEGQVIERLPVPDRLALEGFIGEVWQTPPMFSALKRDGRPLYDYARKGQSVDVQPRRVRIDRIDVIEWQPPLAMLRVFCGKGTYIRSLANDLGGHLISLVREAVGSFLLAQAMSLDQLSSWENYVMPIEAALPQLQRLPVDTDHAARLRHGLPVEGPAGEALALGFDGHAVAIVDAGRPKIVFGPGPETPSTETQDPTPQTLRARSESHLCHAERREASVLVARIPRCARNDKGIPTAPPDPRPSPDMRGAP